MWTSSRRAGSGTLLGLAAGKTDVSDAGLRYGEPLTEFGVLPLRDTKTTGAGLVHIEGLKKLDHNPQPTCSGFRCEQLGVLQDPVAD
jgi:hypothetical protein